MIRRLLLTLYLVLGFAFIEAQNSSLYLSYCDGKLAEAGARLSVIWVVTDPEVCHQRMIDRNSDRDTWKLANWEEYLSTVNFTIPENLRDPDDPSSLILYYNSTDEQSAESFENLMKHIFAQRFWLLLVALVSHHGLHERSRHTGHQHRID